ncbi:hypothetical protein Tco_0314674 [Tanacetum coccineum]
MVDPNTIVDPVLENNYPHRALKNKGIVDSGCSRHMTRNKAYLAEFQDLTTDDNVADLLTKAFDVSRFQFLVVSIGMINP